MRQRFRQIQLTDGTYKLIPINESATQEYRRTYMIAPDLPGYVSPVSGKWVEGRKQRRDDLARTECRPLEAGEEEDNRRHREENFRALEKKMDQTVVDTVKKLTGSL